MTATVNVPFKANMLQVYYNQDAILSQWTLCLLVKNHQLLACLSQI